MALFWAGSGAAPTTAAHATLATISGCKTYLQIQPPSTRGINVVAFGVEFATALTVATTVELVDTALIACTMVTAHVAAGVQPYGDGSYNTTVSAMTLGTTATGWGAPANAEGTITSTRTAKEKILPIGAQEYEWEWSLGREFVVPASHNLRIRLTTTTTAPNVFCWVLWDE